MNALSVQDAGLLGRTPITETVPQTMKGMSSMQLYALTQVASLRKRGLITITLDWDRSTAAHVTRVLEITPAGLLALESYRHGGVRR
jgi:hypothetical protein